MKSLLQFNKIQSLFGCRTMSSIKNLTVKVKQGTVVGQEGKLFNGQSYYAFKGIPYAQPPIGNLRFKPPVPLEKFSEDILDCTKERDVCFHKDLFLGNMVGSEDCLFLNVYTPKLRTKDKLPVMVFVHGGAFLMGSGNSDMYLPLRLIEEDVIVVTLNYRLGILGFLYLPDGDIPGNAGLKDQLLAFKWVNENIHEFGGDSNNITLFGQSAGSASIHFHLLSPLSRKYFHKVILQSGTANMEWVIQANPIERTRRLAELMGIKGKSDKEIGEILRSNKIQPIDMLEHLLDCLTQDERRRGLPMPFKPVIEEESDDAIVTKSPMQAISELNTIDKPVIMGYTTKEGITMLFKAATKLNKIDEDLAQLIPRGIDLEPNDPKCLELANEIRKFYFNGEHITDEKLNELTDLLSDYHFGIGINMAAELHAKRQHKSKLYFYQFSYDGGLNMFKKLFQFQQIKGACHGDELFYLFQTSFTENPKPNSKDDLVMKKLCRMWTNFARTSDPTPQEDYELFKCKWEPVKHLDDKTDNEISIDYLDINENLRMSKNPDEKRMNFWRSVYKKYNQSFLKPKL